MILSTNDLPRGWLYVPNNCEETAAVLVLDIRSQGSTTVSLAPALARVVERLAAARNADAASGWPPEAQGWRSPGEIAQAVAARSKFAYLVNPNSVRKYARRINAAVFTALAQQHRGHAIEFPPITTHRRGLGIRLEIFVDIVRPKR